MNQKKNLTQTSHSASEYLAPSIKVMEIKNRTMLCISGEAEDGTEDGTEGSTKKWYLS